MYSHAKKSHKKGFSLIEVLTSVALFSVIMTVAMGALFMVINANKSAKSIKIVVNNINLAIEGMTRDLRVGYNYCGGESQAKDGSCDTSSGSSQIFFTTDEGQNYSTYRLNNGAIERRIGSGGQYLQITAGEVDIEEMDFFIQGTEQSDDVQPYVTIIIKGSTNMAGQIQTFLLQTTVSQRKLAP